jgi:hypothetical protein
LFIVSGANIQQYIYFCKGFGGKSIFIGLQGGLLLGDPVFYALAGAVLMPEGHHARGTGTWQTCRKQNRRVHRNEG